MRLSDWVADPLTWGHGPRRFEAFLEPTCPYSARAFPKLFELVDLVGTRVTVHVRLHSQPWHLFSGIVTRAIVAASTLPEGREAARRVMGAVYADREAYEFEGHFGGPNLDTTPHQLIARLEAASGLALRAAYMTPGLDAEVRWHTRYARQNGIHVSPTFMIDGLVQANLASRDPVERWVEALA
jgi:hypothetical protein